MATFAWSPFLLRTVLCSKQVMSMGCTTFLTTQMGIISASICLQNLPQLSVFVWVLNYTIQQIFPPLEYVYCE